MKYLAVDPGEVRVGLAVSDPGGKIAMPLAVIHENDPDEQMRKVATMAEAKQADAIVFGMPYTLRREHGPAAQRVRKQIEKLRELTDLPVITHDERMTTTIAEGVLLEADVSRTDRKRHTDKLAATVILQSFLQKQHTPEADEQC
ncbi:MAG: Holliday junction resolvase RuvX [Armatimonadota bacterium]